LEQQGRELNAIMLSRVITMRIWVLTVGEPLPTDEGNSRLLRSGILTGLMAEEGHQVVWWTSTYDHTHKRHRFNSDTVLEVEDNLSIVLLHSLAYKSNVSIRRIVNHYGVARKFARLSETQTQPDIILCSYPTIELSRAATIYGEKRGIPVVLDVRDLWPDIFLELVPRWTRGFMKIMMGPISKDAQKAFMDSCAIVGPTMPFVDWGLNYAKRSRSTLERVFPMGYSSVPPGAEAIVDSEKRWKQRGISRDNHDFVACFFGTMGRQFELETVIGAARRLQGQMPGIRFVLCGSGDSLEYYRELARGCQNVIFPGWVDAGDIWTLMRRSAVGLAPYRSSPSFRSSLPNKSIEYLSAGLPVVSSLKGELQRLLARHDCGITYENGNVDELAAAIIALYNDRERLEAMSGNARALYQEKFVAEKVYTEMIAYLESVVQHYRNDHKKHKNGVQP
jgi:glycosyltransferase involved in cell wall biosynthesis